MVAESKFVSRPCLCRVVVLSCGGVAVGPPTAFPRTGPRVPWVSCLDPRGCHRVQDDPVTWSHPCVCTGWSRDVVRTMRSRSTCIKGCVSRSCATEKYQQNIRSADHTNNNWARCWLDSEEEEEWQSKPNGRRDRLFR